MTTIMNFVLGLFAHKQIKMLVKMLNNSNEWTFRRFDEAEERARTEFALKDVKDIYCINHESNMIGISYLRFESGRFSIAIVLPTNLIPVTSYIDAQYLQIAIERYLALPDDGVVEVRNIKEQAS